MLGQAVGTAAVISVRDGLEPAGIYEKRIEELKQTLMDDDCYLSWNLRKLADVMKNTVVRASVCDASALLNGIDRQLENEYNGWKAPLGSWVELDFGKNIKVDEVRMVFDSDLNRESWDGVNTRFKEFPMRCNVFKNEMELTVPATIVKAFRLEVPDGRGGWRMVYREENNYIRLVKVKIGIMTSVLRLVLEATWGCGEVRMFAFDVR